MTKRPAPAANVRRTGWVTSVHVTETCDEEEDSVHLITQVSTTPAPTPDEPMLSPILDDLREQDLAPKELLVPVPVHVEGWRATVAACI